MPKAKLSKENLVTAIKELSVLELADLVKTLETEFGVSAAAPMAVSATVATAGPGAAAPAAEEEKTEFNIVLKEIGANKINVIKAVREVTSLGLKEAKDLVEAAPKMVKQGIGRDEANAIKVKLEGAGAVVEVS